MTATTAMLDAQQRSRTLAEIAANVAPAQTPPSAAEAKPAVPESGKPS